MPTVHLPDYSLLVTRRLAIITATVLLCIPISAAACADWPEFRGPTANGWVDAGPSTHELQSANAPPSREFSQAGSVSDLPVTWSRKKNVDWRCELPGQGWSSPVVSSNVIYMTAAIPQDSGGYRLALLMVRADSGELFKKVDLFEQTEDAPRIHQKNSHASPTPFIEEEKIFLHFGHQGTACCNLDGEVLWKNSQLGYPPVHGNGGSPVIADELLIFSRDGADISQVTALDKNTGHVAWTTERKASAKKRFSFCTPLIIESNGRQQLIIPGSDVVQSLEPSSGKEIWRVTYSGYSVVPRPLYYQGLVFISTGYDRPKLLAIDPSGSGDLTETHVRWETDAAVPKTPSLIGWQSDIILISDNGICTCLDARSGGERWRKRLGGDYSASPILSGSHLYSISETGVCTIVDISDSPPSVLAVNDLEERTLASPAVIGDSLLIRTAQALYRISD